MNHLALLTFHLQQQFTCRDQIKYEFLLFEHLHKEELCSCCIWGRDAHKGAGQWMQHNELLMLLWKWSSFSISNDPKLKKPDCYNSKPRSISQGQPLSFLLDSQTEMLKQSQTQSAAQKWNFTHLHWFAFTSCTLFNSSRLPSVCPLQRCNPFRSLSCVHPWAVAVRGACRRRLCADTPEMLLEV